MAQKYKSEMIWKKLFMLYGTCRYNYYNVIPKSSSMYSLKWLWGQNGRMAIFSGNPVGTEHWINIDKWLSMLIQCWCNVDSMLNWILCPLGRDWQPCNIRGYSISIHMSLNIFWRDSYNVHIWLIWKYLFWAAYWHQNIDIKIWILLWNWPIGCWEWKVLHVWYFYLWKIHIR